MSINYDNYYLFNFLSHLSNREIKNQINWFITNISVGSYNINDYYSKYLSSLFNLLFD